MNEKGYTLIEMAVVVLLIGLTIGIAVPRLRETFAEDGLRKAARQLIGMTREARGDAVREQIDYELHIDLDRQRFWVYGTDRTAEKRDDLRKRAAEPPAGVRINGVRISGDEKRMQGEAVIRLSRKGYMQPARIQIASGDRELALVFNPYIPSVEIVEGGDG